MRDASRSTVQSGFLRLAPADDGFNVSSGCTLLRRFGGYVGEILESLKLKGLTINCTPWSRRPCGGAARAQLLYGSCTRVNLPESSGIWV
jgi:hypothetical protein